MPESTPTANHRRNTIIAIIILIILLLLLLLRCNPKKTPPPPTNPKPIPAPTSPANSAPPPPTTPIEEKLTPATISAPATAPAGSQISLTWTGPDNPGDYITITLAEAPKETTSNYTETKKGSPLELTVPMTPGPYELRYIANRSKTILGRAPIEVTPTTATLDGPAEVILGKTFSISWTGPNNKGDFVTIVAKDALDAHYGSFVDTSKPSPQTLTAPTIPGEHELRYVARQGNKVLARRPINVLNAEVSISAPDQVVAGSTLEVTWTGPDTNGDYITIVPKSLRDGQYGNHTNTSKGSPLSILVPVTPGDAELRYMTGQGGRVLGRRAIKITAAEVTMTAPAQAIAGTTIEVTWTGPNNSGDYITIVPTDLPDGRYGNYTDTSNGSPLQLLTPVMEGNAELRYMTGQGGRILARRPIQITAAEVTLSAPPESKPDTEVSITWTGPNNPGDYITIVTKSTPDGQYGAYTNTPAGSPLTVKTPKEPGEAEIRYMSGQGSKVLKRIPIKIVP